MADAFGNFLRDSLNDHLRGGTAYTPATTHYYALMLTLPLASGGGSEVTASGYARVAYTNNGTNYPAAVAGLKQNANLIDFGTATADLGTIVGIAVYDASTGGNLLAMASITPTTVLTGNAFSIGANGGSFTFSTSCAWSLYLQDKILDLVFGGSSFTVPATTYFALMTVMSAADGTGGTEAAGGSYGRVSYAKGTTNWPPSSAQVIQNANVIDWGTATSNLGVIVGVEEYDASTSGNLLTFTLLTGGSVTITTSIPFELPAAGFMDTWIA